MTQITKEAIEAAARAMCEAWHYAKIGTPDGNAEWKGKQAQYRKQAQAAIEAALPFLSSPGKDGGQEVEAEPVGYCVWINGKLAGCAKSHSGSFPVYAPPQPASTALVERLTDEQLRDIADSKDTATCRARLLAALSASTSREGER